MKEFRVPIKASILDYSDTKNLWLTLNDHSTKFDLFRCSNNNELLLGINDSTDKVAKDQSIEYGKEHQKINIAPIFDDIANDNKFTGDIFYIDSDSGLLKSIIQSNLFVILFKKKQNRIMVLPKESSETTLDKEDFIIGFEKPIDDAVLKKIEMEIVRSSSISYALLDELITFELSHKVTITPLFIINYSTAESYSFSIRSTLNAVTVTIDMIKNKVIKYHYDKVWKIETVLHEALVNAITYGNELDDRKYVHVLYEVGEKGLRIIIKDEGSGFDVTSFSVPVGTEALDTVSGRGIYIMKKFAQAIFFNQIGNETMLFFEF